jgi:FMN phosphatase YigB (HAD superfamily)
MNASWKVIFFDFDDTLYMKTTYEFVPNLYDMLTTIRCNGIQLVLLTYNTKALAIMKAIGLERYFDFIIMIASKQERKSKVTKEHAAYLAVTNKSEILFFDNDPFNVYDMETLGITSILVNPITGLSKEFLSKILRKDFVSLKSGILSIMPRSYNYVERTTYSQNLQVLDRFLYR